MNQQFPDIDFIVLNLGYMVAKYQWGSNDISSPFARIYYVKSGRARLRLAHGEFDVTPGHMYYVPSYTPHSYEVEPGFGFYYLFLYQRTNKDNFLERYDIPTEVRSNEATQLLFENYCHLYPQLNLPTHKAESFDLHLSYREYVQAYMDMDVHEHLQLRGMVEIILSYYIKHSTRKVLSDDARVMKVIEYVSAHICEDISIDRLADETCLTKSYLIRMFRENMNITPLQYIIKRKMQYAQNMLLESDVPVSDLAHMLGFSDASYFIRLFRKNIGFTPQEYRNNLL